MKRLIVLALLLAALAVITKASGRQNQPASTISVLGEVKNPGV